MTFVRALPNTVKHLILQRPLLQHVRFRSTGLSCSLCEQAMPRDEILWTLYINRQAHTIYKLAPDKCRHLQASDFAEKSTCALTTALARVLLDFNPLTSQGEDAETFKDILYFDAEEARPVLESLIPTPQKDRGNLTGDHGKQLPSFLANCIKNKCLNPSQIGSVVDVGGQNTSTVTQIGDTLGVPLSSLIVDISSITPALRLPHPNVHYAIGDAYSFFSSAEYEGVMKQIHDQKKAVFYVLNNMLNVLPPESGWQTLKAVWNRLNSGDYLFISGLAPEQLEKYGMKNRGELDGIIAFHRRQRGQESFYKSALSPHFPENVRDNLTGACVLTQEKFTQKIETHPSQEDQNLMEVVGLRLLALRKS